MLEQSAKSFELHLGGLEFSPLETILLVVALGTALVSLVQLIQLSRRDRRQQRVASLRAITTEIQVSRRQSVRWFDELGAIIARTPLVGAAERDRLATKLASAGLGGRGRVATLIASRFLFAMALGGLTSAAVVALGLLDLGERTLAIAVGVIIGWRAPDIIVGQLARRRMLRLEMGFPDALDMLVICAEAGLGLEQAMGHVARDMQLAMPEVAEEFGITEAEMRVIEDRRVALENLAKRTGIASLRGLVTILNQSVRFGTPLSDALRQLAAETRLLRISRLEEQAGRLAVLLLLPVMVFILPCLFLVIGGPVGLKAYDMFNQFLSTP